MSEEIWKDVAGYNGRYKVSNKGNVMSCTQILGYTKEIVLKYSISGDGYGQVSLQKKDSGKKFLVHRLVAHAFIPNSENKPQINHKNMIRDDNRVENLEWCTASENMIHAKNNFKGRKGSDLKPKYISQYSIDGKYIKKWRSMDNIRLEIGVNTGSIYRCCQGKAKTAGGFIWKYSEVEEAKTRDLYWEKEYEKYLKFN